MNLRPTYLIAATTLFSVLSTGCGGGGGGSGGNAGYSDASLNGLYYGGHFNLNTGGTESSFTAISFDGRGQGSMDVDHNRVDNQVGTRFSDRGLDQTYSVQADASAIVTASFPASGGS